VSKTFDFLHSRRLPLLRQQLSLKKKEREQMSAVSALPTKLKYIAILRSKAMDRMNESLISHVDKTDLCDDRVVTSNPVETHPHCTIAYGVPSLNDSLRRKLQFVISDNKVARVTATIDGALAFPVRDKIDNHSQVTRSYDFLTVKLKASRKLNRLHHLISTEAYDSTTKNPHEGKFQPHATVCILKPGRAQKYLQSEHPFSKALQAFQCPITFDILSWAQDGDRSAPTTDISLTSKKNHW
jgi:hypothetical protein